MRHIRFAIAGALMAFALPAAARPVTLGDISLDVPDAYAVKEIDRGVQVKSSDEMVLLFIEKYEGKENETLIAEHDKYWTDNGVESGGDPTTTAGKNGDIPYTVTRFEHATWKGAPTVVRYLDLGPIGPKEEHVLLSLWSETAAADKEHDNDISGMVGSMNVKVSQ